MSTGLELPASQEALILVLSKHFDKNFHSEEWLTLGDFKEWLSGNPIPSGEIKGIQVRAIKASGMDFHLLIGTPFGTVSLSNFGEEKNKYVRFIAPRLFPKSLIQFFNLKHPDPHPEIIKLLTDTPSFGNMITEIRSIQI